MIRAKEEHANLICGREILRQFLIFVKNSEREPKTSQLKSISRNHVTNFFRLILNNCLTMSVSTDSTKFP